MSSMDRNPKQQFSTDEGASHLRLVKKDATSIDTVDVLDDDRPMENVSRPELEAKLEAIEARMDGRVASMEGKIDALFAKLDARESVAEQREKSAEVRAQAADGRMSRIEADMTLIRSDTKSLKITIISAAVGTVIGIAAFNATVLSNMVASFESGKSTATAVVQATEQMKQTQEQLKAIQERLDQQSRQKPAK